MILVIAPPTSVRSTLLFFLKEERISAKVCDSFAAGRLSFAKAPHFDLVLAEHQVAGERVEAFITELARASAGHLPPIVVFGVPLRAEEGLLRSGALSVFGAGFSPRSVALHCANLKRCLKPRKRPSHAVALQPKPEFTFGSAIVQPERRRLKSKRGRADQCPTVPLSRLQLRLLETLHTSPGAVADYEMIFHSVWHRAYQGNNAAIREAVSCLRARFAALGLDFGRWVTTVYGTGYRYDPD